jgi:hypothetical protein
LISFANGVKKHNDSVILVNNDKYTDCDIAVIFGFYGKNLSDVHKVRKEVYSKHVSLKKHCIFLDADLFKYAGNKSDESLQHLRISYKSIYPDSAVYLNDDCDSKRWDLLRGRKEILLKDYRGNGNHILFCMNSDGIYGRGWSTKGVDIYPWLFDKIKLIRKFSDRPIKIRFHPNDKQEAVDNRPLKELMKLKNVTIIDSKKTTLKEDCNSAWACVVYNTSASVIPLINGIPVFTDRKDCIAYPVANTDLSNIEKPFLYDRNQWLYNMSYSLWNKEEMSNGHYWKRFKEKLNIV